MTGLLGDYVRELIDGSMRESPRSLFARTKLGVSDIGHCHEYARRVIVGAERDQGQDNYLAAFVGTAVGAALEAEYAKRIDTALIQSEVVVKLDVYDYRLRIPGHPDVVDEANDLVIDFKTVDGLGVPRNTGATQQQKFQVSLYANELIAQGTLTPQCTCAVVFVDRSGRDPEVIVDEWTYDEGIVEEAESWLSDVIYAVVNNEEASKDKPRSWCFACCEFAPSCRGLDTDVSGLITDPIALDAIRVYKEATEREKAARKDRESAESVLHNVSGMTPEWNVRWVEVPGGHVEYDRRSYQRLTISPNRPPRRRAKEAKDERGPVRDGADV